MMTGLPHAIFLALAVACMGTVFAQEGVNFDGTAIVEDLLDADQIVEDIIADAAANKTEALADFILYLPPKMIADTEYEGMLLIRDPATSDLRVSLATDNNEINIPPTIIIPSGANHILFPVTPRNTEDDTVTIHAIANDGRDSNAVTTVYSIASIQTSVIISAPTDGDTLKTSSKNVPIRIFLTDDHEIPVFGNVPIDITLTSSSSSVQFSASNTYRDSITITIPPGQYSSDVMIRVNGDGEIYATGSGLKSDSLTVDYHPDDIEVRIGIAPNPGAANSLGYYYVWLEQDGSVYVPDKVLDVYLSVASLDVASFTAESSGINKDAHHVRLVDGIHNGIFYIFDSGETTISASIPGIGGTSVEFESMEKSESLVNHMEAWIFPDTPADTAWAVIGTYSTGENGTDEPAPAEAQALKVSASSDGGIIHDTEIDFEGTDERGLDPSAYSALEVPLKIVDIADHIISFSANEVSTVDVEFTSKPQFGLDHTLEVFTIPANINILGDIAFASVMDDGGFAVDVGGIVNTGVPNISQVGDSLDDLAIKDGWIGGTAIIEGTHLKEGARIFVQVPGMRSSPTSLAISGVQTGIEIWAPNAVNVREEFPVTIHAVDANGVPVFLIRDTADYILSTDNIVVTADDHTRFQLTIGGITDITIIANDRYLGKHTIQGFENSPHSEITVRSESPGTVRLGDDIILDVITGALENPHIDITGLEFWEDDSGKYKATPEGPGEYDILVNVSDEGWEDYTKKLVYIVEKQVDVDFEAVADDGVAISVVMSLTPFESDPTMFRSGVPGVVKPGVFEMEIPLTFEIGSDRIYSLKAVSINGDTVNHAERFTVTILENADIVASYEREITIDYVAFFDSPDTSGDVEGSRMYKYGDTVMLRAPPVPELYGLLWNLPEKWENLPADAVISGNKENVSFPATDSNSGNVIYSQSYSLLMALISLSVVVPVVLIWKKSPDTFLNLGDSLHSVMRRIKSAKIKKPVLKK